ARTLTDLVTVLGEERRVAVSRELTKRHEETWRGTLGEARDRAATEERRGEHVLVVAGAPDPPPPAPDDIAAALKEARARGLDRKAAVAHVATALGVPKRVVYEQSL